MVLTRRVEEKLHSSPFSSKRWFGMKRLLSLRHKKLIFISLISFSKLWLYTYFQSPRRDKFACILKFELNLLKVDDSIKLNFKLGTCGPTEGEALFNGHSSLLTSRGASLLSRDSESKLEANWLERRHWSSCSEKINTHLTIINKVFYFWWTFLNTRHWIFVTIGSVKIDISISNRISNFLNIIKI